MVMDRLVTRHEIAEIVRAEIDALRRELDLREERLEHRLRVEIQRSARQNLVGIVTAMGIFNATLFAGLKFF